MIDLARAKLHLRLDSDDEDDLVEADIDAAVGWALNYCNISAVPDGADAQFDAATLIMVGELYKSRELGTDLRTFSENPTATRLIDPFRMLRV